MSDTANRAFVLSVLVLLLAATRVNHFAAIPDASWAVFFIGGFYLARWTRWAFPLLMVFAVLVDWIVIRSSGLDFWQHYCVSPGYWLLLPAYFSLWAGGMLLGRNYQSARWWCICSTSCSTWAPNCASPATPRSMPPTSRPWNSSWTITTPTCRC